MSEGLRNLISAKAGSEDMLRQAQADGMATMIDDGLAKILAGVTTPSEVMKKLHRSSVTFPKQGVKAGK